MNLLLCLLKQMFNTPVKEIHITVSVILLYSMLTVIDRIIVRYENDYVYFSEVFNNPSVMLMYKHQVHGINNIQYSR